MNKVVLILGLWMAPSAFASNYGYVWAPVFGPVNTYGCFPINSTGHVVAHAAQVENAKCFYAFAWAPSNNGFQCFAVTEGGAFIPNTSADEINHCSRAYVWAQDGMGRNRCYGTGADGEVVPGIGPTVDAHCINMP